MIVGILVYPSWRLGILLLFVIFLGFPISDTRPKINSIRTRVLILFSLLLFFLQVTVTINGNVLVYLIPRIGDSGPFVPITDFGIEKGLAYSSRFLLIVFSSILFVSTTDPTLLAHSLTLLKIPYRYSFSLVIALRFIPLFDSENEIVRMAQRSRGITPEVRGLSKILRTIRYTFFPLLVSALSRVETLTLSMEGRGFGYRRHRTYVRQAKWSMKDSLGLIVVLLFLSLCILLSLGLIPQLASYV